MLHSRRCRPTPCRDTCRDTCLAIAVAFVLAIAALVATNMASFGRMHSMAVHAAVHIKTADAGLAEEEDTIVGPVEDVGNTTSLLDIVIAYHMEPLDAVMQDVTRLLNLSVVQRLQPRVFAYVKGGELAPFRDRLATLLGSVARNANSTQGAIATNVVSMPDEGSGPHVSWQTRAQAFDCNTGACLHRGSPAPILALACCCCRRLCLTSFKNMMTWASTCCSCPQ